MLASRSCKSGWICITSLFFCLNHKRIEKSQLYLHCDWIWSMGLYKMFVGDDFLSHTIITMVLSWLIILLIVKLTEKFERYNFEKSTKYNFFKNTKYAINGLKDLIKSESSFKIELLIVILLLPTIFFFLSFETKLYVYNFNGNASCRNYK